MEKESGVKTTPTAKKFKQRYFIARELQFSIALLIVLALLSGIFLQTLSSELIHYYGFNAALIGFLLIIGYILIVVVLALSFTHRLIGPFKRLEYEMKMIAGGDYEKKLNIRSKDDLHVKNFVQYTNNFLTRFTEMSKEYNSLNNTVSERLDSVLDHLSRPDYECEKVKAEIKSLREEIHKFRQRW